MAEECPDDIDDGPEIPFMMYMPLVPDRRNITIPDCKVRSKRARVEESHMIELVIRSPPGEQTLLNPSRFFADSA